MGKKRKLQHAPTKPGAGRSHPKGIKKPNSAVASSNGNGPAKRKGKQRQQPEKPTIPFEPEQRILLIGEGDLSFSAAMVEHHRCVNVTATVFEKDAAELLAKYPHAETNAAIIRGELAKRPVVEADHGAEDTHTNDRVKPDVEGRSETAEAVARKSDEDNDGEAEDQDEELHDHDDDYSEDADAEAEDDSDEDRRNMAKQNNRVLYNIDATKPPASLIRTPFDAIIFNFPHVGGKSTDVNRQVRYNQELLVSFFTRAALPGLAPGGSVVVTLFEGEPYTLWNIRDLARHAGLQVERSFRFQPAVYPGYHHARTLGVVRNRRGESGGGWKGEDRPARSYVFKRKGDVLPVGKKRQRGDDDSDDDDDD